jgi:hypothetical protein
VTRAARLTERRDGYGDADKLIPFSLSTMDTRAPMVRYVRHRNVIRMLPLLAGILSRLCDKA